MLIGIQAHTDTCFTHAARVRCTSLMGMSTGILMGSLTMRSSGLAQG